MEAILDRIALLFNCRKTWPRIGCGPIGRWAAGLAVFVPQEGIDKLR